MVRETTEGGAMAGVCAGTLRRWLWPSDALLTGRIAFRAGDCTSFLMPFTGAGDPAVAVCPAAGATVAEPALGPAKGFAAAPGVPAFPEEEGRDER